MSDIINHVCVILQKGLEYSDADVVDDCYHNGLGKNAVKASKLIILAEKTTGLFNPVVFS